MPLTLTLSPLFSRTQSSSSITALHCSLTLPSPCIRSNTPLLTLPLTIGITPTQRYDASTLRARDNAGLIPLDATDENNIRTWFCFSRDTVGDVHVEFLARPRKVGLHDPVGPRVDLRADARGLAGCGGSFVPLPPLQQQSPRSSSDGTEEGGEVVVVVKWDLPDGATQDEGIKAVWTFGEGPGPHRYIGSAEVLQGTYFAIGPLRSSAQLEMEGGNVAGQERVPGFGFYWFGEAPASILEAARWSEELYSKMSAFFSDPPSANNPYRIFVRCADPARGFGGTAFKRSYCLEYDSASVGGEPPEVPAYLSQKVPSPNSPIRQPISVNDLRGLLAHEMVHNWPLLGKAVDSDQSSKAYDWYNEGIANYYSILLPHRFGLLSPSAFFTQVNDMLSEYYTNPLVRWSNKAIADAGWSSFYGLTLPYVRGFAYFLQTAAQLQCRAEARTSDSTTKTQVPPMKTLDDIVLALLQRKNAGQRCSEAEWLDLLSQALGEKQAREGFAAMASGELVIPDASALGSGYAIRRRDKERFDLCMEPASFGMGRVKGLKARSRAERAGLREGDEILDHTYAWLCESHFERLMQVRVRRDGEGEGVGGGEVREMEIVYWPRSWEKVEAWEFVVRDEEGWEFVDVSDGDCVDS